jgi:hypothetical protein
LFLAPALVYVGWTALQRWRAEAYAQEAVSALSHCLMGPAGAEPGRQLRAVAIGGDLVEDRTWPGRCEPFLRSGEQAVRALHRKRMERCEGACCVGDAPCHRLGDLDRELRRLRTYLVIGDRSSFDAERFASLSRELGLLGGGPAGAPEPPPPAHMLDHRRMQPLYQGDYLRLLTDPTGDRALSLLFYEQDLRYGMCRIPLSGGGVSARCNALPDTIPVGMAGALLASERGAPERMYAQGRREAGWVEALYDVESGAEISRVADRPSGGFVWRDGTVAHLASGPPHVLHRLRHGEQESHELSVGATLSSGPRLIWDQVVWTEAIEDGRHRVLARRVLTGDEAFGPLVYVGLTPPLKSSPSIEICRSDEVLALVVGSSDGRGGVDATLALRDDTGWRQPTEIDIGTTRFGFTCREDTATLSWIVGAEELPDLSFIGEVETEASLPVRGRYAVHRLRCGGGHCNHDHANVDLERYSRTSRYVAGDAGDAMVVLWRSVLGDVRMKHGPLHALADAPARAVFDDVEHDGFGWDLESDPIIGRSGNVVVLLSRQIGTTLDTATYGFVVGEDGAINPVEVDGPAL